MSSTTRSERASRPRSRPLPTSLHAVLGDPTHRAAVAHNAIAEAEAAIAARGGLAGAAAQIGLATINRLRPGFLLRHVYALLPALAVAIEPHWHEGAASGDPRAHLETRAHEVSAALLDVTDRYVAAASDATAIAVYHRLRSRAPQRVAEQMPRIARFIDQHTPVSTEAARGAGSTPTP